MEMTIASMASNLGINKRTVEKYLEYLSSVFLVKVSQNYSKKEPKRTTRVKRIHVMHPSIAIHIMEKSFYDLDSPLIKRYVSALLDGNIHGKIRMGQPYR